MRQILKLSKKCFLSLLVISIIFFILNSKFSKNLIDDIVNRRNYKEFQFNGTKFKFLLSPKYEEASRFLMINLVIVRPEDVYRRMLIRSTWANATNKNGTTSVFVCGINEDKTVNDLLIYESFHFNDIVQVDFMDTYFNLTLKSIIAFKWIAMHFTSDQVQYVLKVDDDVVVDLENLLKMANDKFIQTRSAFYCFEVSDVMVNREKHHKFYLSKQEYEHEKFPIYCSGSAYVLTFGLLKKIASLQSYPNYLKFEDVYITGILKNHLKATSYRLNQHYVTHSIRFKNNFGEIADLNRTISFFLNVHHLDLFFGIYLSI